MYVKVMVRSSHIIVLSKCCRGASLIEVMIAVVIIGFGLLGIGGMQAKSIANNQSAYYRSISADLASDLAERIRALRAPVKVTPDASPQPGKPPDFSKCVQNADTVNCQNQDADRSSYQALVNSEMLAWLVLTRSQLPSATYTLTQVPSLSTGYFRYTLVITWLDDRENDLNTSYSLVIE